METKRKGERRQSKEFSEENKLPLINRAHRDCEKECLELKAKQEVLISLIREFLEVSAIATKEITTVRGDFVEWAEKARDIINF